MLNAYQVAPIGGRAVEREIRKLLEAYFIQKEPSRVPEVQNLPDETIEDIKSKFKPDPPGPGAKFKELRALKGFGRRAGHQLKR